MAQVVRGARGDVVSDTRLAFLVVGGDGVIHLIFKVTLVDERALQLAGTGHGECRVVDDRRGANASHPAVEPARGVAAAHVVNGQL